MNIKASVKLKLGSPLSGRDFTYIVKYSTPHSIFRRKLEIPVVRHTESHNLSSFVDRLHKYTERGVIVEICKGHIEQDIKENTDYLTKTGRTYEDMWQKVRLINKNKIDFDFKIE